MSTVANPEIDASVELAPETPTSSSFDYQRILRSPAFIPGVLLFVGMFLAYLPLMTSLWDLWTSGDGYYSHGLLVPPIMGYIIVRRWPQISAIKVKPAWIALIPVLVLTYIGYRAGIAGINLIMAACLVGTLIFGTAFVAGWRWMLATLPATLYSVFALPFWSQAIDAYTNPLQQLSSKVAYQLLRISGFGPYMSPSDPTTISLNNFQLNVAVPCSGLKLVLALTAFVVFFVLIARLKVWANTILLLSILPMALLFNGLRIALIGVVGEMQGEAAAMQFHDYSGFLTLAICFFALFKFAKALGWKD